MKFDKDLLRTVLLSLGVVTFIIGVYQTVFFNDLTGNYFIFMASIACWMPLIYWRQQEAVAAKIAAQEATLAEEKRQRSRGGNGPKKRR